MTTPASHTEPSDRVVLLVPTTVSPYTASQTLGSVHRDSVNDTREAYTQFHGWVLSCLWCDYMARGKTKRAALALMQEHYDQFSIEVHA